MRRDQGGKLRGLKMDCPSIRDTPMKRKPPTNGELWAKIKNIEKIIIEIRGLVSDLKETQQTFEIRRDTPPLKRYQTRIYHFASMGVGDSFDVPCGKIDPAKKQIAVLSALYNQKRRKLVPKGWKFVSSYVTAEEVIRIRRDK